MTAPVRATRRQVAHDHGVNAQRDPEALVATALRTKSVHAREILSELAWPGHTPEEILAWAGFPADRAADHGEAGSPPGGATASPGSLAEGMDPAWLARCAQVLAVQTSQPDEQAAARALLEVVADRHPEALPPRALELLLQLRVAARDPRAAQLATRGLSSPARSGIRQPVALAALADLGNPALFDRTDEQRWLRALEGALGSAGMAPVALLPSDEGHLTVFDRLCAPGARAVPAPELVTVVMSTFCPGPPLFTALRSLIEQTWSNVEILLVDDASGPEFASILARAAALDPRIRLIRKAINGGTYRARNTALRRASGDFFTVLDSDDWLHPQAIEVAVHHLLEHPGAMATIGQGVRVTENLELNRPGYVPRVTSAPSLLVRTHPGLDRVGFFDPTSKSADTEYAGRLQAAFGQHAVADLPVTVTFLRGGETLSASEFSRGWRHGARHAYKCAYRPWHDRIAAGAQDPFVDPTAPRRFPEPRRWAKPIAPDLVPDRHFDLCLAGDWRRWGGPQKSMIEEISAAREAGLRVAMMHLEALRFMTRTDDPLCTPILDLVNSGAVEWIQPDDDVDIDVLMIRYPPILQYPPLAGRSRVRAEHVLIMANQAPLEPDGSDQRYVVADVTERTRELFGVDPVWVPQSVGIREVLIEQDPNVALTSWDNPGLIDVDQWTVREHAAPGRDGKPVVIGRYSRDNIIKFAPTLAQIRRGYEFGPGYEVRMMGAVNTLNQLLQAQESTLEDLPAHWVLLPHKAVDVVDFLGELDFFLYLDNPDMFESFGRTILEAAASGVLTIAHPKHQPVFGDTIDYALPGQAQDLIAGYVADPSRYAERVARTRELVRQRFGRQQFLARLADLGTGDRAAPGDPMLGRAATGEATARPARDGERWAVRTERLRTAADAGRADQLTVVHAVGAEQEVARWWGGRAAEHPGDDLPEALLRTAPPEVAALVTRRDHLVHVARRLGTSDVQGVLDQVAPPAGAGQAGPGAPAGPDQEGQARALERASIAVPVGWTAVAWWETGVSPAPAALPSGA